MSSMAKPETGLLNVAVKETGEPGLSGASSLPAARETRAVGRYSTVMVRVKEPVTPTELAVASTV